MSKPTTDSKMTKQQLVTSIAKASGHPETTVRAVLDATTALIKDTLVAGAEPYGLGLGRFSTKRRPAKRARDIRRGTDVMVPERISVTFKPSQPLAVAVNGGRV